MNLVRRHPRFCIWPVNQSWGVGWCITDRAPWASTKLGDDPLEATYRDVAEAIAVLPKGSRYMVRRMGEDGVVRCAG